MFFSDGSIDADGFSGRGHAIYHGSNILSSGLVLFGSSAEVTDTEIAATVLGTDVAYHYSYLSIISVLDNIIIASIDI